MTASPREGEPFLANDVRSYPFVTASNVRYGASDSQRGLGYCFGYIYGRTAVKINKLLRITHRHRDAQLDPLVETCALVQRFIPSGVAPAMPWAPRFVPKTTRNMSSTDNNYRAEDLGIQVWEHDQLSPPEIVPITAFSGQFARATIKFFEPMAKV